MSGRGGGAPEDVDLGEEAGAAMRQSGRSDSRPADLPPVRWIPWLTASGLAFAGAIAWVVSFVHFPVSDPVSGDLGGTVLRVLVVVAVPIALLLASLYAFWRFRLERLAYAPGPILVASFADDLARDAGETVRARRLRAMFEQRLAASRVYRSTAVPIPALSNGFLHIVEHAGESLPTGWGFITRLLRVLAPEYAYVVRCSLVEGRADIPGGDDGRAKGLLVELSRLPRSSVAPVIVWDEEWSRVIERAANRVAELILPRTPQCRTPPWTPWCGLRIPEELFDTFHLFQSLKDARRFDEAMGVLRGALKMDPSNLALRLELGKLQEQMRMHLDALLTYDDLIGLASRKNVELSSWWNRPLRTRERPDEPWSDPVRARTLRVHHPVVEVARYRHALLLGLGYELADEWWQRPEWCDRGLHLSAREDRRRYLRRVLSERFKVRYRGDVRKYLDGLVDDDLLRRCLDPEVDVDIGIRSLRAAQARVVFTMASLSEMQRLISEARAPWRARREVLSTRALRLMRPWAGLRHVMAVSALVRIAGPTGGATKDGYERRRKSDLYQMWWRFGSDIRYLVEHGWPAMMEDDSNRFVGRGVKVAVDVVLGRPALGALRSWHEHYNAACVYALMLSPDVPDESVDTFPRPRSEAFDPASETAGSGEASSRDQRTWAGDEDRAQAIRAAITELKKAVAAVGSGRLASQRDWILTNDPDFDQLRGRDEFRDFEVLTFGSVSRAARRGPRLARWEQITSVSRGVLDAARRMTALWRSRLRDEVGVGTAAVVLGWIENEEKAWAFLEGIAVDHRDWSRRNKFREDVRAYSGWQDFEVAPAQVVYTDTALATQYAAMSARTDDQIAKQRRNTRTIERTVNYAIRQHNKRWAALAATLRAESEQRCCPRHDKIVLADELAEMREIVDRRGIDDEVRTLVEEWARQSLRRWEALASWFDDETAGGELVTERAVVFHQRLRSFGVDRTGAAGRLFTTPTPPEPPTDDERWQDDPADRSDESNAPAEP